tara:strand:- start:2581 stop:3495 length:915 start_codon:yes stop_codon:yes gene_type:complete
MRNSITNKVKEYAGKDESVFLITGDAGFGVLDDYQKSFPGRFLNLGVAEQNMISFAAGLSLSGYKVFLYNIIPFLLYRCYEQVRNDICYQRLPITLIGIGSGLTYAPGGMTHYSVEDIAIARTLPNIVIMSPSDPLEAVKCVEYAYDNKEQPTYIRIAKSGEPVINSNNIGKITKPIILKEGKSVAVLFHGSISTEVIKAVEGIKETPLIISVPMLQPFDFTFLGENLKSVHTLITVEEHFIEGGLGSILSEWIVKEERPYKLKKIGIKNEFIHAVKNTTGMRSYYKFSFDDIRKTIEEAFNDG